MDLVNHVYTVNTPGHVWVAPEETEEDNDRVFVATVGISLTSTPLSSRSFGIP
jgi:hypothetical protein